MCLLPPPARSCWARRLLNCALRWWQRTQHHRFPRLGVCADSQWPRWVHPGQQAQSCRVVFSTSAAMYRRHSLHFCGRRARPLDFCWKVMALADCPATPTAPNHRAARSDTLASRYALVSGTSPLSLCQLCSASQCAQLGFAMRKCWGGTSPVLRKCWSVRCAQAAVTTLRRATASAHGQQRGPARNAALCLDCAARGGATYQASPLCFARRSVGLASARGPASPRAVCTPRLACASCWSSRSLRLGLAAVVFVAVVAHARYGHPLRFYIRPHFAKCSPVTALKLRFVSPTAARPRGFAKQALCKVAYAGVGRTAVGASRSLARPTRRQLRALVVAVAPWH